MAFFSPFTFLLRPSVVSWHSLYPMRSFPSVTRQIVTFPYYSSAAVMIFVLICCTRVQLRHRCYNATAITEVIVGFSSGMQTRTTGGNNRLLVENCCIYLHVIITCNVASQRHIRGHEMSCCIWIRGEIHRQCVNQYFIYSVTWFNFAFNFAQLHYFFFFAK